MTFSPAVKRLGAMLFGFLIFSKTMIAAPLLPLDEKVHIKDFKNGVIAYMHKTSIPEKSSVKVVIKEGLLKDSYDCSIASENLSELDAFFEDCRNKIQKDGLDGEKRALAVITVGDLLADVVSSLVEKHFASLSTSASYVSLSSQDAPIRVLSAKNSKLIGLRVNFSSSLGSLRNLDDLRSKWKEAISQQVLQNRLLGKAQEERNANESEVNHFFLSADSLAATLFCQEEEIAEMTEMVFNEIDRIKLDGIHEEEFHQVKASFLKRLHELHHEKNKSNSLFAAYHEEFLSKDALHPSFDSFISASLLVLPEITFEEVGNCLHASIMKQGSIDVLLPNELIASSEMRIQEALTPFFVSNHEGLSATLSEDALIGKHDYRTETISISPFTWESSKDAYDSLPLTTEEKRIIDKIFTTMARKNVVQLAFEKRSMERNGKRINHVHPMKMLGTLFSDERLKDCMKKIRKSSFKWNGFLDGLIGRLKEEYKKDNLVKYAPGLSKLLGVNSDKVKKFLKDQQWEDLVIYLLENT